MRFSLVDRFCAGHFRCASLSYHSMGDSSQIEHAKLTLRKHLNLDAY